MSNQDSFLHMRISSADKALLVKAANGSKLTDFVINASLEKARKIMNTEKEQKAPAVKIEKRMFSMRHSIDTIDDYIRKFGYAVTNDNYSKNEMTLRKDIGSGWMFDGKLNKRELVEFANNL